MWLLWQLVEFVVLLALLSTLSRLVPESWPRGIIAVIGVAVLAGAWLLNYRWIRRLRHDEDSSRPAD